MYIVHPLAYRSCLFYSYTVRTLQLGGNVAFTPASLDEFKVQIGKDILKQQLLTVGEDAKTCREIVSCAPRDHHIDAANSLRGDKRLSDAFKALRIVAERALPYFERSEKEGGLVSIMSDLSSRKEAFVPLFRLPFHYPIGLLRDLADMTSTDDIVQSLTILRDYCAATNRES